MIKKKSWLHFLELTEQVGYRLRRKGLKGRTVTVKIRFGDFRTITRSRTLGEAIDVDGTIYKVVRELFLANSGEPPWRLVGYRFPTWLKGCMSSCPCQHFGKNYLENEFESSWVQS